MLKLFEVEILKIPLVLFFFFLCILIRFHWTGDIQCSMFKYSNVKNRNLIICSSSKQWTVERNTVEEKYQKPNSANISGFERLFSVFVLEIKQKNLFNGHSHRTLSITNIHINIVVLKSKKNEPNEEKKEANQPTNESILYAARKQVSQTRTHKHEMGKSWFDSSHFMHIYVGMWS